MKTVRTVIESTDVAIRKPRGRINAAQVDQTCEEAVARQAAEDDMESMQDAARYAQRVRKRLGFSQVEFAQRIEVSLNTVRNWEQGKRCPTGAAKALLRILDKAPKAALAALEN